MERILLRIRHNKGLPLLYGCKMRRMPHHMYVGEGSVRAVGSELARCCCALLRTAALGGEDLWSSFSFQENVPLGHPRLETFGLPGPLVQFREATLLTDPAGLQRLRSLSDFYSLSPYRGPRSFAS
jgi:hypothetical protein